MSGELAEAQRPQFQDMLGQMAVSLITQMQYPGVVLQLLQLRDQHWSKGIHNQLALSRLPSTAEDDPARFTEGCGSFYRDHVVRKDAEFSFLIQEAAFLQPILDQVQIDSGRMACRARLMQLMPKTCLSYHADLAPYRYHVPVVTNKDAFFVCEDLVTHMSRVGHLYRLRTNLRHTAVNASFDQPRLHLVISTDDR